MVKFFKGFRRISYERYIIKYVIKMRLNKGMIGILKEL